MTKRVFEFTGDNLLFYNYVNKGDLSSSLSHGKMEIKQVFIKSDNKFYNIRGHTDKLIIRLLVTYVQYNYRLQGVGYKTLFKL